MMFNITKSETVVSQSGDRSHVFLGPVTFNQPLKEKSTVKLNNIQSELVQIENICSDQTSVITVTVLIHWP